ncbi:MAG: hypothetical protein RIS44_3045 [Pseudomonadota bacterium]|jgi:hypothetical protein
MNSPRLLVLVLLNGILLGGLLFMWFDRSGQIKNVGWKPPAPFVNDYTGSKPSIGIDSQIDLSQFVATLERPLFSNNRRPLPKPVVVAAVPAVVDPLENMHVTGLYAAGQAGGLLVRIDGIAKKVLVGEMIGPWTVKEVTSTVATLIQADQTRNLTVTRSKPPQKTAAKPPDPSSNAAPLVNAPAPNPISEKERVDQVLAERLRYANEHRAKYGLPPLSRK